VHPHLLPARQLTVITYTDQTVGTVNNKKLSYLQGTAWSAVLVETVQNVAQMFVEWYLISPTTGEWHSSLEHSASRHLPVTSWQCKDPSQQFGVQSGSADVQRPQHPTRSYLHCLIQEWEHGYNLRSTTMMLCQPFTTTSAKNTFDALHRQSGTHYQKLFSIVTLLQFLSLGEIHSSLPRLSLLPLLTNTTPGHTTVMMLYKSVLLLLFPFHLSTGLRNVFYRLHCTVFIPSCCLLFAAWLSAWQLGLYHRAVFRISCLGCNDMMWRSADLPLLPCVY